MKRSQGLFSPHEDIHDACGVGFVCQLRGAASHQTVEDGLQMLENMAHRGATGCEPDSGDGAGIMVQLPHRFFERHSRALGINLPAPGRYAVGMVFLPQELEPRTACERILEDTVRAYGMVVLGWRDVPVDSRHVGPTPRRSEPRIRQIFVGIGEHFYNPTDFDRRLYLVRQRCENLIEHSPLWPQVQDTIYICVFTANRLVYKGMLTALQLRRYFPDLSEPDFESRFALIHSRFSTNTFPSWRLAQPFRYLAHNGEINTLRGNRNWMRARSASLRSPLFGDELARMFPIFSERVSDSATLDNAMQFLAVNGRTLPHAALMLVPEAWQGQPEMDAELRAFYEYHACLMEPWDGPAAIAFSNGRLVGALLDRNGLRPARYTLTRDGRVILASETGALPIPPDQVLHRGRLRPGRLFLIDLGSTLGAATDQGRIIEDAEIKDELVDGRPYGRWLRRHLRDLASLPPAPPLAPLCGAELRRQQHLFGYSQEDLRLILAPMALSGAEPVGSMGNDTPLACLSPEPQLLFSYFRQLFAQVTNPPLDAIREELVTSLDSYLGRAGNLLDEEPAACHLLKLPSPLLRSEDLARLREVVDPLLRPTTLSLLFPIAQGPAALEPALEALCQRASQALREGFTLLILSDRGADPTQAPLPTLLATAAVHHHLIREGTRTLAGLIVETGEAREVHHLCLLLGYGASAVNPYLALDTVADLHGRGLLYPPGAAHAQAALDVAEAQRRYLQALGKGVLKVASKMGISTLQSYRGAQIFEAVGLDDEVLQRHFTGTAARLHGVPLATLAEEGLLRHRRAFGADALGPEEAPPLLPPGGQYQWRREGERHQWGPDTVAALQEAVRARPESGAEASQAQFRRFSALADDEARLTLRGCLALQAAAAPIPLAEVEPAEHIARRFVTGAMSFGSLGQEAHETLALAMNQLGGKSNSGEGGEDPARYQPDAQGRSRRSAIKQIASARFGVTVEYLVQADELQIKMAQGAKPGEGGQLPGEKVDGPIARVRHATPGVGLISPPPHHDIYSIEDLAQLIHDLRHVNPRARISVKLVSEYGVGTVAAGVAKAKADHILISGDGGGTGAAPLTSIKHAGLPWELGLAEAQQVLRYNRLRGLVVLQVDGQLKTGRDVVVAAALGAEEFGFGTAALISMGCVMMRVCHLNTCPVGVATQDPELRRRFAGQPEHVIRYLMFVAEEVREHLARLGLRRFEELVGRADLLRPADLQAHWKACHLDLGPLLHQPEAPVLRERPAEQPLDNAIDQELWRHLQQAAERGAPAQVQLTLRNTQRSVGAWLAGRVAERYGQAALPEDLLTCRFTGTAGQSFGAFLPRGVTFALEGDANDYLGKGLSGGRIVVAPPREAGFVAEHNVIAGNVIGYGATSGEMFLRGQAGERFCVRNSGARAVVEGLGDHGCEYMTGGVVVVLGEIGRNFAAGMSGGVAFVLDEAGALARRCNPGSVALVPVDAREEGDDEDEAALRELVSAHLRLTGSAVAERLLARWGEAIQRFVKVLPHDLRRARAARAATLQEVA